MMKFITIDELPGQTPAKHYDLIGRTVAGEAIGVQNFRVGFTRMEKTGRCDPHTHDHAEQLFIILKGEMIFVSPEGETRVKEGQAVMVYPGEEHSNYNAADGETIYLTITSVPAS
jgi:quercetin dioxygenase-like cupin family protein